MWQSASPPAEFISSFSSEQTRRAYRTDIKQFLTYLGSGDQERKYSSPADFERVSRSDVKGFLREMRNDGLSGSTRRRRLSALRRFFDWLAEQYSISGNPTRGITVVDTSASEPSRSDFLSRQELETLVSVASEPSETGPRDRALVLTIVYASLRRGETAALNIEDVRPLGRHWVIDLPRTSTARGGYVKIPDLVATAVQNTAASYDADEGPLWRSFSNRNRGARMSPDALYKLVRRLGRKADVGPVDIEMLRQSGLRLASKAGARVTHLQDQARLEHRASAARYADGDESSARLEKSATDFLKLDV